MCLRSFQQALLPQHEFPSLHFLVLLSNLSDALDTRGLLIVRVSWHGNKDCVGSFVGGLFCLLGSHPYTCSICRRMSKCGACLGWITCHDNIEKFLKINVVDGRLARYRDVESQHTRTHTHAHTRALMTFNNGKELVTSVSRSQLKKSRRASTFAHRWL